MCLKVLKIKLHHVGKNIPSRFYLKFLDNPQTVKRWCFYSHTRENLRDSYEINFSWYSSKNWIVTLLRKLFTRSS